MLGLVSYSVVAESGNTDISERNANNYNIYSINKIYNVTTFTDFTTFIGCGTSICCHLFPWEPISKCYLFYVVKVTKLDPSIYSLKEEWVNCNAVKDYLTVLV